MSECTSRDEVNSLETNIVNYEQIGDVQLFTLINSQDEPSLRIRVIESAGSARVLDSARERSRATMVATEYGTKAPTILLTS